MKKVLFFIFIITSVNSLYAQSIPKILELGDEQFENNRFLEAIPYYEKVYAVNKRNYYAGYQLAICYEQTLQFEKAEQTFKTISEAPEHEYQTKSIYKYATLNKRNSHFDLADSIYLELAKMPNVEPSLLELANQQREGCLLAKREQEQNRNFKTELIKKLNSNFHDYGATENPANGNIVFATSRNLSGEQYKGSQFSGLLPDMMMYEMKGNGNYSNISGRQKFNKLNTKWSEGSGVFNAQGDKFYYTSCENDQGNAGCKIKFSQLKDDKWSNPMVLNDFINEANSENKHPSLSVSGDTLFFSSDRPGGHGGSDIWMSLRGDEGETWLPAINMGKVINTPENEITPYYSSPHGSLIFSSNGHVGYGGYDIYGAKGNSFFSPDLFNIGFPFNSTWDDTYFFIGDSIGYLSSNKENKEVLDLYKYSVPDEKLFLSLLFAGELMVDGQIMSKYRDAGSIDLVTFRAEDYEGYALFQPVVVKKKDLRKLFNSSAVEGGTIASNLESARVERSAKTKSRVEAIAETKPVELKSYESADDVERLYFDYSDFILREPSKVALKNLYERLQGQSYTRVNLLAYSDYLGSDQVNVDLSQKRGNTAKEYLISLGMPSEKIEVLARGELRSDQERDHWFRRVMDRRVELHVDSPQQLELSIAKNIILRKPLSLDEIAQKLNLDPEKVYQWNGSNSEVLTPGTSVRLYIPNNQKLDSKYFITEDNIWDVF
ncbi:MAG: OmpA family protein [Reichenbachiella sp.]|uniref:OmpA family protein n=1 Tax=Reichenbachiella sp. TaxID=2184521 RepID=UPI00329686EC